ncbi:MAG: endolytic transglycosylase MltG, partial [Alcanivoracaceae bacterium]
EDVLVDVPRGASLSGVLVRLEQDGRLGAPREAALRRASVRLYDLFSGVSQQMHVGEYRLAPGDTLMTLLEKLENGAVLQRAFTLVEGWNFRELRAALAQVQGLAHSTSELNDAAIMKRVGSPGVHPEGQFAPDTYFFTRGDEDLALLKRAHERQKALLESAWENRAPGLPYDSPYQALVMASIVEKETGAAHERAEIAGVFVSRLRKGMRLQTDPTVIYGLGEAYDGNLRRADLRRETAYNTYVIRGLPPTPIAMPGADAIQAALNPAATEALYFVARGDGTHKFSRTLEEHEQAVRDYQLRRRENYRSAPEQSR